MLGVDKEFFKNCGREVLSSKTVDAAIGAAIGLSAGCVVGAIPPGAAPILGITYLIGHITARAQARGDADRPAVQPERSNAPTRGLKWTAFDR